MSSSSSDANSILSIEKKLALLRRKVPERLECLETFIDFIIEYEEKKHGKVLLESHHQPACGLDLEIGEKSAQTVKVPDIPKIRSIWSSEKQIPKMPVSLNQFCEYWKKASPLRRKFERVGDFALSYMRGMGCLGEILFAAKVDDNDWRSTTVDHVMELFINKPSEWLYNLLNCNDFELHGVDLAFKEAGESDMFPIVFHYRAMICKEKCFDVYIYLIPSAFKNINGRIYQHLRGLC